MPLLSAILPGTGLNTAYAEGKFIIGRDNGALMKLDWSAFNPGTNGTPNASIKPLNDDLSSTGPMSMSSDLAYWKRF